MRNRERGAKAAQSAENPLTGLSKWLAPLPQAGLGREGCPAPVPTPAGCAATMHRGGTHEGLGKPRPRDGVRGSGHPPWLVPLEAIGAREVGATESKYRKQRKSWAERARQISPLPTSLLIYFLKGKVLGAERPMGFLIWLAFRLQQRR